MKILIADKFPESQQQTLRAAGHDLTYQPDLQDDALIKALPTQQILIVRSTRVQADALAKDASPDLKLIIRAGAGTNTIDKTTAAARDVRVCNVPGANSIAVAELVFGLLIALDRNLPDNALDLRNQRWNKKRYSSARGLCGQTIALLGLGAIGIAVATRARAFGMEVRALAKPNRSQATLDAMKKHAITVVDPLPKLLSESDIVSLHLPANPETKHLVNAAFLADMKPNATLINTSRGELIDETALLAAIKNKGIRAGLDVYQNEPAQGEGEFTSALANHPNIIGTHHIGASTEQAQTAVADGVLRVIDAFTNGKLLNCVNS